MTVLTVGKHTPHLLPGLSSCIVGSPPGIVLLCWLGVNRAGMIGLSAHSSLGVSQAYSCAQAIDASKQASVLTAPVNDECWLDSQSICDSQQPEHKCTASRLHCIMYAHCLCGNREACLLPARFRDPSLTEARRP